MLSSTSAPSSPRSSVRSRSFSFGAHRVAQPITSSVSRVTTTSWPKPCTAYLEKVVPSGAVSLNRKRNWTATKPANSSTSAPSGSTSSILPMRRLDRAFQPGKIRRREHDEDRAGREQPADERVEDRPADGAAAQLGQDVAHDLGEGRVGRGEQRHRRPAAAPL